MPDTANYIADLDLSYPRSSDSVGYGDNEIITVKRALKQSFPGDPTGVYNSGTPDLFDAANGVLDLGPRYLNSIPAQIADLVAGQSTQNTTITDLVARQIPVGAIILWAGAVVNIPAGWHLCDGNAYTPDLRDKFVIGAGNSYAVGATGGATSVTSGAGSAHSHGITVDGHTLTTSEIPAHGHPYYHATGSQGTTSSSASGGILTSTDGGSFATEVEYTGSPGTTQGHQIGGTGGGQAHSHTASSTTESSHTHSVATMPPYYALCYIMYIGA